MLSCATINAIFHCIVKFLTPGYSLCLAESQIIDQGIRPVFKKNGVYPVLADLAELIANSIAGNFVTQSICFSSTHCLSICVTVQFACSVAPSVCGWYALDILS